MSPCPMNTLHSSGYHFDWFRTGYVLQTMTVKTQGLLFMLFRILLHPIEPLLTIFVTHYLGGICLRINQTRKSQTRGIERNVLKTLTFSYGIFFTYINRYLSFFSLSPLSWIFFYLQTRVLTMREEEVWNFKFPLLTYIQRKSLKIPIEMLVLILYL